MTATVNKQAVSVAACELNRWKREKMKMISGNDFIRRVKGICGTSVDDIKVDIQNESNLSFLAVCLAYEAQHQNRLTMLRCLRSRIRKLENITI